MTTTALRHMQVAHDYRMFVMPQEASAQKLARVWFNRRKIRQQTRKVMDFVRLPRHVTLRYKLK